MAVFRVERNKGYTVMSNHHLRNKELSLKAKGLLSQMLSLPEDWDYTLKGLSLINREKIDAIREAIKELERAGYIVRSRERDEKGRLRGADYVIFEQPQPPTPDLPTLENPTLDNPTQEKPTLEKPTLENPTQLNKDIQRTDLPKKEKSNTDLSSTHSIPILSPNPSPCREAATPPERKGTEAAAQSAVDIYREIIKDNIDYHILKQDIYNNQNTFTEWYRGTENEIPKEYRVMSFPQPERGGQDKTFMDAAATEQTARTAAEQPQEPHPVIPIVLTAGKPAEKLKEITDRLEQGITELFDSERYKEYLKVMSKFHNYSFRNTVLIAMQKPDASLLAGFSAWKNNFERNVMRGQKGIKIIAPSPYKIKQEMQKIDPHTQKPIIGKDGKPVTEEKEITIPAYKVVSVFDVSQTEGKELPDIAVDELTGDVDRYKDFFAALEKTSPVPIAFENIEGGSHGYYHLEDKRIAINEGMSELQTLKTAIHEIAHAKLHDIDLNAPKDEQPRVDRRTREVEAESVAYTVCQHYGLDTSDYSFGYVAGWSSGRELSELKSSLETIRSAAAEIINSIDANFAELQKAQDKEQTAGQEQPTREGQEAAPQPEAPKKADTAGKEKPEAAPKEAFTPETIYRVRRNPYSDSRENSHLLQAYVTQENGRAKMGDVLYTGTPEKCRELMGQLKSGELTEGDVKQLYAKAQETAQTTGQDKDTFSIYQIKGGDETRDFRFEPYDRLQAAGNVVDKANYELVYSAPLAPETSLEDIYTRFNIDHPKDFKGHSLSVSDVVVLHQNGQDTAHYVDSVGFRQVPEFLQEQKQLTPDELTTGETIQTPRGTFHVTAMSREQIEAAGYGFHHQSDDGKYLIMGNGTRAFAVAAEQPEKANPLKHIEDTVEQNDNNFDGIINNTPTVDELEAKVKAGETISLVDLANAVKADKERGKEAKPEKKPSIRAQLRADKEKAQKKNAKQKLQDLERS